MACSMQASPCSALARSQTFCLPSRRRRQHQQYDRLAQCQCQPVDAAQRSRPQQASEQLRATNGTQAAGDHADAAQDHAGHDAGSPSPEDGAEDKPFPARYKVVLSCMTAFIICNMSRTIAGSSARLLPTLAQGQRDGHTHRICSVQNGQRVQDKVNMSVAIIPMARDFSWSPSVAGVVQSSFFWGYALSQIPGGLLANRFSGRALLPAGVGTWSGFTAVLPLFSSLVPTLCVARAAVGIGEGVAPSAVNDIVVKAVPRGERARATSTIFGGLHVGSILGLLLAPPLIENYGWPVVFYVFGALGIVWVAGFEAIVRDGGADMRATAAAMQPDSTRTGGAVSGLPYRAFLRNRPVRALMFTHFCNNWFNYTMLAWLPSYFTQTLDVGLSQASQISLFPSATGVAVSVLAGQVADRLLDGGMPVRRVRSLAQSTAFLAPTVCLAAAGALEGSQASIVAVTAALGLNSFSLAGLYCTHQDMSPRYAGPLLGLTNTSGAVPGIVGVAVVGFLYDMTRSWSLALFGPSCLFFVLGTVVYLLAGSSEEQAFGNNEPFAVERWLRLPWVQTGERSDGKAE